jgi:4-nitrophenyl phosphatase
MTGLNEWEGNLTTIHGLILDMDGVLWRMDQPLADLPKLFEEIREQGWRVILATNNATRSIQQYQEKFRSFGLELDANQIINSAQAAGRFLQSRHPEGGRVYVIGEDGLVRTLEGFGFIQAEEDVLAVVAALDRGFNYERLSRANHLIRSGASFIGTNPDRTFPSPNGLVPGAGSILAAIEAASDTEPIVVGKPAPEMFRQALERMGLAPEHVLVVGDRLETDIAGGQRVGCKTGVVLTGVTSREMAAAWEPKPDFIADDVTNLLADLARTN